MVLAGKDVDIETLAAKMKRIDMKVRKTSVGEGMVAMKAEVVLMKEEVVLAKEEMVLAGEEMEVVREDM